MSEILTNVWGKLYAWALPSGLALGAFWLFVYPRTADPHGWIDSASDAEKAAVFAMLTAVIAICLNALSRPLYGILEGYVLWPKWFKEWGVRRHLKCKRQLEAAIQGTGWRRGLALERLALYPFDDDEIVPTRLGNAIRSFETYGKTRFNLDSQTLWYELCAVAPKYIPIEIESARSSADFFVASIYLSAALGVSAIGVGIHESWKLSIILLCIPAFAITLLCHWLVVRATGEWALTVQALVNIGRSKLADGLGLKLPDTLEQESRMWGLVTKYVFHRDLTMGRELDHFRKTPGGNQHDTEDDEDE